MGRDSEKGRYASPEGSRIWEYLSAIFCASGSFCVGTVVGWNSPSLDELRGPDSRIFLTPADASTLTASLSVGFILALLSSIFMVDRIGRRNSILVSTVPMMINWGLILVAESVLVLVVARIAAGFSMGLIVCASSVYIAESLSANIRGSLGAIGSIMCYIGVLFMFGVAPHLGLRVTAGFCVGFTTIFAICFWFVPESPYFLVMVGKVEEAEGALVKLRGKTDVADELELIKATLSTLSNERDSLMKTAKSAKGMTAEKQNAFKRLFTVRGNVKSFLIGMLLILLQHFSGFEMILYYCHLILRDMGSQFDVYLASLIFGVLQIFAAALTFLTVDRFGRRPLILGSGLITSFLLAIVATYFLMMEHMDMDVKRYYMVPLCSVFLLVVVLNIGVMSLPKTIQAEIYAIDVKMLSNCIVGISGSVMTMLNAKFYLLVATSPGFGHSVPFFVFAFLTFIHTALLIRWLPETKGKTLLQIQNELNA